MTTDPRKAPPTLDLGRGELGLGLVVVLALTYVGSYLALAAPPEPTAPARAPREPAATAAAPASPRTAPRGASAAPASPARAPRVRTRSS